MLWLIEDEQKDYEAEELYRLGTHLETADWGTNTDEVARSCNPCYIFHRGMIDDMKQIRKFCNLRRLLCSGIVNDGEFSVIFL